MVIHQLVRSVTVSGDHQPASSFCPLSSSVPDVCFQFSKLSVDEVLHQLQHLDVGNPTGPVGVSAFILRAAACEIAEPLTVIFNKSLDTYWLASIYMEVL